MASASVPRGMRTMISYVKKQFPEVKNIDTAALALWMGEDQVGISPSGAKDGKHSEQVKRSRNLVLLDVRPEVEAVVGGIPSYVRVDPDEKDMKKLVQLIKDISSKKEHGGDPLCVVMYCSVGYRASILATRLQRSLQEEGNQDSMDVYNLEGSVFKWANENRRLINAAGEPTTFVHPYNSVFGLLVDAKRRKYTP